MVFDAEKEQNIIKDFNEGMKIKEISEKYLLNRGSIYYILNKNDIPVIRNKEIEDSFMEQLSLEYQKGLSIKNIAEKYKIEKTRLCRMLNSYSISDTLKQTIINLSRRNLSCSIIAQRLSLTTPAVKEVLRSFNIRTRLKKAGLTEAQIKKAREDLERSN